METKSFTYWFGWVVLYPIRVVFMIGAIFFVAAIPWRVKAFCDYCAKD